MLDDIWGFFGQAFCFVFKCMDRTKVVVEIPGVHVYHCHGKGKELKGSKICHSYRWHLRVHALKTIMDCMMIVCVNVCSSNPCANDRCVFHLGSLNLPLPSSQVGSTFFMRIDRSTSKEVNSSDLVQTVSSLPFILQILKITPSRFKQQQYQYLCH